MNSFVILKDVYVYLFIFKKKKTPLGRRPTELLVVVILRVGLKNGSVNSKLTFHRVPFYTRSFLNHYILPLYNIKLK